ncbi:hypothetical protein [Pseudomonas sp. SO81]|uniref:hypothetical protein n=1 Tax=Pseudomonas sp. SO81 TaxID=2983246 RepID=UPI0025A3E880|nr:hypothetical protein [Pseudomonas sp. SO81]WJN60912.1 hypothetical protein OH686_19380 [Pseudomonas sp. SO81]
MSTLKAAIDAAGGPAAAARICGKSPRAIYKWLAAGALPRTEYTGETKYAELLAAAAAARGEPFQTAELKESAKPSAKSAA